MPTAWHSATLRLLGSAHAGVPRADPPDAAPAGALSRRRSGGAHDRRRGRVGYCVPVRAGAAGHGAAGRRHRRRCWLLDTGCGAGVRVGAAGGLRAAPWGLQRRPRPAAAQESAAGLRAAVLDAVDGHADMVALHAQAQTRAHFERLWGRTRRRARPRPAARLWFLQAAAGAPCWCVVVRAGEHEGGGLSGPCWRVCCWRSWAYSKWPRPSCAARRAWARRCPRRIREVAQCEPDARSRRAAALPADGALELDGLRFAYPDGALVLDGVSLRVAPGERVAIQGESGAGKSTLLHLILRLEDPQAGQVRYGGRDARDCAQADWHRRIALLSQDAPVFLGTLRTNLRSATLGDEAALWRAGCRAPGRFRARSARRLDAGGETGSLLSAGQARRLCLAGPAVAGPGAGAGRTHRRPGCGGRGRFPARSGRASRARRGAGHACLPAGAVDRRCVLRGDSCMTSSPEPVLA